jgi:hypothetical protein
LTVAGSVPMNAGMLLVACAIERPRASVSTQEKSSDSRNTVEKALLTSAAEASSTMLTRRRHRISRVTGSKPPSARAGRAASSDTTRQPERSTSQRAPGPTISVDSGSSTIAGPSSVVPAASRVRSYTGVSTNFCSSGW